MGDSNAHAERMEWSDLRRVSEDLRFRITECKEFVIAKSNLKEDIEGFETDFEKVRQQIRELKDGEKETTKASRLRKLERKMDEAKENKRSLKKKIRKSNEKLNKLAEQLEELENVIKLTEARLLEKISKFYPRSTPPCVCLITLTDLKTVELMAEKGRDFAFRFKLGSSVRGTVRKIMLKVATDMLGIDFSAGHEFELLGKNFRQCEKKKKKTKK